MIDYITIGTFISTGFAVFVTFTLLTFTLFLRGYKSKICAVPLFVMALILCLLLGLSVYQLDADKKTNKTIKTTINDNYDNVVNFHNGNTNKSFVSDGSKYTFDYDKKTKTLTVFTDTNSSVDAVFINGIKQNNSVKKEKTSDNTNKKKDCVSYQIDDKNKTNDKVDTDNASSTTTTVATDTDLQQKIQNKIQSKYNGAVMTSFDTINLSGTFSCDDTQYNFVYKDNMLEVSNINDINDITYYKISN